MKLFLTPMARMIFGTTFFFSAAGLAGAQTTQPAATEPSGANMTVSTIAAVGTAAPDFSLLTNTGTHIRLSDYVGKQIVVLYFYPKAGTPGCTAEACAFRDALAAYDKADIAVLGISADPVDAISKFGSDFHLNFPLLSDGDHKVAEAYGVWQEKNMAGKTSMGVARTTFVIGKDGKIVHVFEKVKPKGHDQQVLTWIEQNMDVPVKS
ncbi:MAG: thioredoxin-dependent thiol peroxidase [Tepidisphaeraceae bacterium]|jgi:peroxiredoxin Q/BCP